MTPSPDGRTFTLRVTLDPPRGSNTSSPIATGSFSTRESADRAGAGGSAAI